MNSGVFAVSCFVSVATENPIGAMLPAIAKSSRRNFRRHAQPARIQPVDEPRDGLVPEIYFLYQQIKRRAQPTQPDATHLKAVELMAMDRKVAKPVILPTVLLVDANADQVRHDVGEAVVVIAFHPHHFDISFGI
jgi:hypothetical protein